MNIRTLPFLACVAIVCSVGSPVQAQSTTWLNANTGASNWNTPAKWSNGLPTNLTDAVFSGNFAALTQIYMATGDTFKTLDVDLNSTAALQIWVVQNQAVVGGSVDLNSSGGALTFGRHNNAGTSSLTLTGGITAVSSGSGTVFVDLSSPNSTTFTVPGGISLGGNVVGARTTSLGQVVNTGSPTIIGDVTFNNGSQWFFSQNVGNPTAVVTFDGNVTLQSGGFTGLAPDMTLGRFGDPAENGLKFVVTGSLSASAGNVGIRKGKTLEVNSASFTNGAQLSMYGSTLSTGDSIFRSAGTLLIDGGNLNASNTTGISGRNILEIGGNFVLGGTNSTVSFSPAAGDLTRMYLAGDLDISATSLAGGSTLNELRLTLDGAGPQTLETAVTDAVSTFTINTLTFSDGGAYSLADNHLNIGSDEYFKTLNLINIGNTTLNLNGLQFFVGASELTEGVYTDFGGTLTVVPEPSAQALMLGAGALVVLLSLRRRRFENVF